MSGARQNRTARVVLFVVVGLVVMGLVAWFGDDHASTARHFLRALLRALF